MDSIITTVAYSAALSVPLKKTPLAMWNILCVDDEPSILAALRRLFRGQRILGKPVQVLTAASGVTGLSILAQEMVHLVISDMRMPEMDGVRFLETVHKKWPATTRVLLTGEADMQSTIAAINRGAVSRYIAKPWNDDELLLVITQVLEQRALQDEKQRLENLTQQQNNELKILNTTLEYKVAERTNELASANEHLKKNYLTSIKVFSNLIELRAGHLVGHSRRVADMSKRIALQLGMSEMDANDVFAAGLLHDIGHIGLSDVLLVKSVARMGAEELGAYRSHSELGEQALLALEDMQRVAPLIRGHHERHDGQGFPDALKGDEIPLGARILALVDTWDDLQSSHLTQNPLTPEEARVVIARGRGSQFDPAVVDAFSLVLIASATYKKAALPVNVPVAELTPGMVLARDLVSPQGVLLLAVDQILTADLIQRIQKIEHRLGLNAVLPIKFGG